MILVHLLNSHIWWCADEYKNVWEKIIGIEQQLNIVYACAAIPLCRPFKHVEYVNQLHAKVVQEVWFAIP